MLQKENRLKLQNEFKEVGKKGKNISSPILNFKYMKNRIKDSRFAFVVSTSVSKKAVTRNKIRRQLREIIRLLIKEDKLESGYDGVFYTKQPIVKKNYQELEKTTRYLLHKANLIK